MGRLVCLPLPTTMTALVLSRGSFHGAPTKAAQTDDEPTAAAKIKRTTTTVARLRGASNEECNFGLLALRQHRRSSTALYNSDWEQLIPTLRDLAFGAHQSPTAF